MKSVSVRELAFLVDGKVIGDDSLIFTGLNGLDLACENEITFVSDRTSAAKMCNSNAGAFISSVDGIRDDRPIIKVLNANLASAVIHNFFLKKSFKPTGINPASHIGDGCHIPEQVSISAMAVIGNRVILGDRVTVKSGVVIGDDVIVGDDAVFNANVTIYDGSIIGSRVVLHSGTVIGSDGYGYVADEKGNHVKRPQVGIVCIEDDVEIGANVCVDRAAFGETRIKNGTKIDNLVQVGHNVVIGENSLLVAMCAIAGSTILGRNVVLGGQTAIAGHIHLDDGVMVAAKSGVHNSQKKGAIVGGIPAVDVKIWGRASAVFSRLPQMFKDLRRLKKKVDTLMEHREQSGGGNNER